ncbi:monovalent cation/H+ antiporter subunit D family protein [Dasania sp. GY-MA-18]|uniref:Proton-conducting transporter membrane subunit n=1 Tax=Dasania phycosphaerae TaxID=2950436 RepID=A0A9J6RPU8_9GAMM|nr:MULTISPECIES: proton-conducting transporter membrane subunit [Dasania]MCR8923895.1 monovalent cation/H+ antiporter subunit D family protein [Dasania sp. GY-MA-18]MCZ0866329.1 proton-conducting transporter membrane subunit [Dasania phycosphaerae]MCZ0870053.1 proton-conducting transporter membrane subunit [Dasania phycosphaerae]
MSLTPELILQLSLLLPVLASAAIVAAGGKPNLREAVTICACLIQLYCLIHLYLAFKAGYSVALVAWQLLPGLQFSFTVEPLGLIFALTSSFLWLITTLYAIGYMRSHKEENQTRFYACFAIAMSAVMFIAFADNLFTVFVFYEILTLSTYPLVSHAGTEQAKKAGRVYLGILLSTSIVFFLLAIVITWFVAGSLSFKVGGIFGSDVDSMLLSILLLLFVFGVAKAAIMPFHRWLPAAMVAPTPVSALLHAVAVVKAGVFIVLKICLFIFGPDLLASLPVTQFLLYLAAASVLLASLVAMQQDNLKVRLAYSTISQLGYITIGALLANSSALVGSTMHIVMHAFAKITLFFCAGAILVTAHKSKVSEMPGLGRQMPVTMAAFFIASLSIIGVPPTGGSWSKWFLLLGVLEAEQWWLMIVLMLSSLLNIVYLLPIPLAAFLPGLYSTKVATVTGLAVKEAPAWSLMAICITTLGCIVLFIYPQALYELSLAITGT